MKRNKTNDLFESYIIVYIKRIIILFESLNKKFILTIKQFFFFGRL